MNTIDISRLKNVLNNKDLKISIVTHVNPDGDAIGSSLGLYHLLKSMGFKQLYPIAPNAFPEFLEWLPDSNKILNASREGKDINKVIEESDLIFCLDFNDLDRTDQLKAVIQKSNAIKVLIDHHPQPQTDFDMMLSQIESSSTCELLYDFVHLMGLEQNLNANIGECLYTGIITDTGSFSYACNYSHTYRVAAHLVDLGVDGEKIHKNIYSAYSENRLRLLGLCLSERLKVLEKAKTAFIFLSNQDLQNFSYKDGDTEGVVNYALSIKNVEMAAILIERSELVKISLRSKGSIDVNLLAREFFNGGGHSNAAGGKIKDTISNAVSYFEKVINQQYNTGFKGFLQRS